MVLTEWTFYFSGTQQILEHESLPDRFAYIEARDSYLMVPEKGESFKMDKNPSSVFMFTGHETTCNDGR